MKQTQARYLQTIYAKETELETLVNRLFSFAKLDLSEAPAKPEALEISENVCGDCGRLSRRRGWTSGWTICRMKR